MNDLDRSFFEKVLKEYENDESISVENVEKYPACQKGENFMSVVQRVVIYGKRFLDDNFIDFKKSVIVKTPYQSEVMKTAFNSNAIFHNEVIAYNKLIPALKENFRLCFPVAECIFANCDMIILEDLAQDGYEMQRDVISLSKEQVLVVLKELANIHGASIIFNQTYKGDVRDLADQITETFRIDNSPILNLIDKNISVALTLLKKCEQTQEVLFTINKLQNNRFKIYERVSELFKSQRKLSVFNHGDCWRNNILFNNSGEVKLIDLQLMRYTSVAADLNYFLYINLIPSERILNFDLYMDTYLTSLHRVLLAHNVEVDYKVYSREWLEKEMDDFSVFGFISALWIAPAFFYDKNSLPDMEDLTHEHVDANYHEDFILNNMTPNLEDRLCSLVINFMKNYNF